MGLLTKAFKTVTDWVQAGYPEEVAKRIVSGELPMDEASRMARAAEQGYGDVLYRGYSPAIPPTSNSDLWASNSQAVAQTYADSLHGGLLDPIRTNASNLADVNARKKGFDTVQTNSIKLKGLQGNPETTGVHSGTDEISEMVKKSGNYQGTRFRNIKDEMANLNGPTKNLSEYEVADTYNILGSRPDVNIRHADAAYDPQYSGPNIMGGLALPAAAGLLAAGQSEDADAGPILKVVSKSQNPMGELRRQVARNKQKGISPENTVKGWMHENTNYDHWNKWAAKVDGDLGGETFRNGTDEFVAQLIGDMNLDKDTTAGLQAWSNARLGRELGYRPPWMSGNANVGLLGATAAGTGAALTAPLFDFGPTAEDKLAIGLAENARNQQHGTIDAPHRGWVQDATMAARGVQRALEGSPASLLFPEGTVDYVETINDRQRDPNNWQRASFFLDWAGL